MSTRRAKQRKEYNYVVIPYRKWLNVYNEKGFYSKFLRQFENLGRPLKFRKRNYRRAKLIEMKYREKEAFEALDGVIKVIQETNCLLNIT